MGATGQIECSSLTPDQGDLVPVYAGAGFTPAAADPTGWHFQDPLDQAPAPTPANDPGVPELWSFDTNLVLGRGGDGFVAAFARTPAEIRVLRLGP